MQYRIIEETLGAGDVIFKVQRCSISGYVWPDSGMLDRTQT